MVTVNFILNGKPVSAEADGLTLLKYLRGVACLKGAKEGCSTGHCGACSVLIDGILARSCVTVLKTLAGKSVETIENLPNDTMLQVIQRSFLDAGAVQCGAGHDHGSKGAAVQNREPDGRRYIRRPEAQLLPLYGLCKDH